MLALVCCFFLETRGDNDKAFLPGQPEILLAPLQPVLNAFAVLLMKTEKNQIHYAITKTFPTGCYLALTSISCVCGRWAHRQ